MGSKSKGCDGWSYGYYCDSKPGEELREKEQDESSSRQGLIESRREAYAAKSTEVWGIEICKPNKDSHHIR